MFKLPEVQIEADSCTDHCRFNCWPWNALWFRLHQWTRRMRHITAFDKISCLHPGIYVGRVYHGIFVAPLMIFVSFLAGLIFGIGLIISGMANPAKVLGFLDLAGQWDPSLMFVMCGAIAVGFFAFLWAKSRNTTLLGFEMKLPMASQIDRRLILGSAMFGIGWGIAGFCPGPALVGLDMGLPKAIIFVVAMLAGMALFELIERWRGG